MSNLKQVGLVELEEGRGGANFMSAAKTSDLLGVGGVPIGPPDLGTAGDDSVEASNSGVSITETSNVGRSIMGMRVGGARGRRQGARGVHAVAPLEELVVDRTEKIRREAEGVEDGCVG